MLVRIIYVLIRRVYANEKSDYAGNSPKSIVRVGNSNSDGNLQIALSTDGGQTWAPDSAAAAGAYGGKVAYSADAKTILWSSSSNGVLFSASNAAFTGSSGLPSGAVIASDKRNATVFYGGSGSKLYVSKDGGKTFAAGGALGSSSSIRYIKVHPTVAGDVWVSTDKGIFHSTTYGSAFTQPSTAVSDGNAFAFGKGTATYPYIYGFFTANGVPALYKSTDVGKTWTNIQGAQGFGSVSSNPVAASMDTAGLVFVGTNGRGVFYGSS